MGGALGQRVSEEGVSCVSGGGGGGGGGCLSKGHRGSTHHLDKHLCSGLQEGGRGGGREGVWLGIGEVDGKHHNNKQGT